MASSFSDTRLRAILQYLAGKGTPTVTARMVRAMPNPTPGGKPFTRAYAADACSTMVGRGFLVQVGFEELDEKRNGDLPRAFELTSAAHVFMECGARRAWDHTPLAHALGYPTLNPPTLDGLPRRVYSLFDPIPEDMQCAR